MNKKFLILQMLFVIFFCTTISCSNDDAGNNTNIENGRIVGSKWTTNNLDYGINDNGVSTLNETYSFYFYSSTYGLLYYGRKNDDSDLGSSSDRVVAHFSYNVSGNEIELEYITQPLFNNFDKLIINNNGLSINGVDLTKSTINNNDQTWLTTLHGTTGNCKWYHNLKNTIWIIGEGNMDDYNSYEKTPWANHARTPNIVVIGKGVTRIGSYSFANPSIGEVEFASTLTEIGPNAFYGATVSRIDLPHSVKKINDGAFSQCKYLTDIYLPTDIEEIGDFAFNDCKKVSLTNTKKLRRIGNYAFMGCKVIDWTDSNILEEIGEAAFTDCEFTELSLPNSLKKIGNSAFSDTGISIIRIGSGLTSVNGTPFYPKSSGKLYINMEEPLSLTTDIIDSEQIGNWTLYVPVGSLSKYSNENYWKNFKNIYESSEQPDNNTNVDDDANNNDSYTGIVQGHKYVDLGLSVKWATCNIGASLPEQYGNYFCWGRVSTDWDTPLLASYMPTTISGTEHDAAHEIWGNKWKIPTKEQFEELIANCTFTTAKINGNNVIEATSKKNKQSIFLPLTGYKKGFYERTDTKFQTFKSGEAVYLMTSEIFDLKNTSAENYYFLCWHQSLESSCSKYFSISNNIYSDSYQLCIRPITE